MARPPLINPPPTSPATTKSMKGNAPKNTLPEIELRRLLREAGYSGYRLHWKVAGRPDIAYPGRKVGELDHFEPPLPRLLHLDIRATRRARKPYDGLAVVHLVEVDVVPELRRARADHVPQQREVRHERHPLGTVFVDGHRHLRGLVRVLDGVRVRVRPRHVDELTLHTGIPPRPRATGRWRTATSCRAPGASRTAPVSAWRPRTAPRWRTRWHRWPSR